MPTLDESNLAMQALRIPQRRWSNRWPCNCLWKRPLLPNLVATVFSRTGTAEAAIDPMPVNISDSVIVLKPMINGQIPKLDKEALIERLESRVGDQIGNAFGIQPADRVALQ